MQKLLASDGYGNHLDEAAVEEILAGLETSDEEGGSSSGEDDGDDGDMGRMQTKKNVFDILILVAPKDNLKCFNDT